MNSMAILSKRMKLVRARAIPFGTYCRRWLRRTSFALLVLTGEDKGSDGKWHARENVIHELGLFQGKLGFARAIVLLEEGTEEFSNIHGIQQIRFAKGRVRETFGDVLATLRREFITTMK